MARGEKTALITGSGRNIGRAIALHLAKTGCNIVLNGSSDKAACDAVAAEVQALGTEALVAMGNVGDRDMATGIAEAALDAYGRVDILVNNAAIRPHGPFLEISDEEWAHVMNVNFNAAVWLSRACLPGMIDNGWGRIINFSGMNAQRGTGGRPQVTASKHAAWGLTKALAREFGPHGITVNIISPGTIPADDDGGSELSPRRAKLRDENPVRRLGNPDDIAGTVDLLISDQGSFINGQLLQINGGVEM